MATTKLNNSQLNIVIDSSGVSDANKLVVTSSDGKISTQTIPDSIKNDILAMSIALG